MAAASDCCGLGCNNCILDRFLDNAVRRPDYSGLFNLFNQKSYQKFRLIAIEKERELIYKLKFELVCDRPEPFKADEQLIATPVSYLMLRAPRDFDGPTNPVFDDFKSPLAADDKTAGKKYFRAEPQRYDKGTPGIYFSRKYTPYEIDEQLRTFKIIVKLEPLGKMSKFLTQLHIGAVCEFKGPFEAFNYIHESIENYVVITQGKAFIGRLVEQEFLSDILGISIVSAFRLVKEVVYESAQTRVLVISCFKNINETFLREDFFKMTHFWCLKHHTFLSRNDVTPEIPARFGEKIHYEKLDSSSFRDVMKDLRYFHPEHTQVLLSGRDSFIDFARSVVEANRFKKVGVI